MARISKNGNLSGAVGNLVFITKGPNQYVRTRPARLKQTQKTKEAAKNFGWISSQDKLYRHALQSQLNLVTDSRYAARHRARMGKALPTKTMANTENELTDAGLPEALVGFDFNALCSWEKSTRFYPQFSLTGKILECRIPSLKAGEEILFPKGARKGILRFDAFAVDPTLRTIHLNLLSSHTVEVSGSQAVPAEVWTFNIPNETSWLIITGTLTYSSGSAVETISFQGSSVYLWAKTV